MIFRTRAGAALVVALAACGQQSGPSQPQESPSATTTDNAGIATPASQFASRAVMFEAFQIQSAQLAQQNAQSPAARAYAAAALSEHQATLQQLSGAVRAAGMAAPSGDLDQNYNAYLDMLRHANAQSFDATYASQQAIISMSASGLYDSFTSTAPDSPLKQWAQTQSPHVHDGINSARTLARNLVGG